jgi:hypothetical protein
MLLPKIDKLVIPREKFTKYALNFTRQKHKAFAFQLALNFSENDIDLITEKIKLGVTVFTAKEKQQSEWGQHYQVIIRMSGHGSKIANVLTAWIDDVVTGEMRLTSVYVTQKEVLPNDKNKTV